VWTPEEFEAPDKELARGVQLMREAKLNDPVEVCSLWLCFYFWSLVPVSSGI
jgi:hypothetical protein